MLRPIVPASWRSVAAVGFALLTPTGTLGAQGTNHLHVGAAEIRPSVAASRSSFTITPPAPAAPTALEETLSWVMHGGRRVLIKATTETGADGIGGDTLVMAGETLAPLTLMTYGGGRIRHFRFEGSRIVGEVVEADGTRQQIDTTLAEPAFAGPSFFTVLTSLPVGPDLDVTLPFFRPYDRTVVWVRYRGLGPDSLPAGDEKVATWRVLGEIGGALAIYWLRQDSHELVRVVSFAPNGFGPIVMAR